MEFCGQHAGLGEPSLMQLINLKVERQRVPLHVHFELTYRCNQDCIHCYCVVPPEQAAHAAQRELTRDEIVRLLDDLAEMGTLYLTFSGGEVLVRPDFFEIASYAKLRGFAVRILTNGIGLTEEQVGRMAALEPLTVELSLYSADPAIHDSITRVPGSFARLIENVQRLKAHGLRIYLKSVMMKPNVAGLAALRQLGQELDVFQHTFGCELSPRIDGDGRRPLEYQLDEKELFEYLGSPVWQRQLKPMPEGPPEEAASHRQACGPAINGCCIDPYGNVFPCIALRIPLGNVREQPFKELWRSPPPPVEDLLSVRSYADLSECRTCELVSFCSRCPGDNLLERGGDWRSCHTRARTVASAEQRLHEVLISQHEGGDHDESIQATV